MMTIAASLFGQKPYPRLSPEKAEQAREEPHFNNITFVKVLKTKVPLRGI
jgi:hypothetical protein